MRLQLSVKLILEGNLTACSFSCRGGLISVMQFLALVHKHFYVCFLFVCSAVTSSIKMCPQMWITRLKGLAKFVAKTIFFEPFNYGLGFFLTVTEVSLVAKCLSFNKSSCIFLYFCITEPLVFLTRR